MAKKTVKKAAKKAAAKKTAKKAVKKTAKKAVQKTAKKAAKKTVKKASSSKKIAAGKKASHEQISMVAYSIYMERMSKGIPGDQYGDWLAAEASFVIKTT